MNVRFFLTAALAATLLIPAASFAAPKDMNCTSALMSTHPSMANGVLPFWRNIADRSNGEFAVTYYEPGTLVPDKEMYPATIKGIVHANFSLGVGMFKKAFPLATSMDLPLGFPSSSATGLAYFKTMQKYPQAQAEFSKVILSSASSSVPNDILTIKKISSLKELKGLRIGVMTASAADIIKALDGAPIQVNLSDMYTSLQRGMLDGVLLPIPVFKSTKVTEAAKYLLDCNLAVASSFSVVSPVFYNSLSDNGKALFDEILGTPGLIAYFAYFTDIAGKTDLEFVKANHGVEVTPLAPGDEEFLAERTKPMYDAWAELAKGTGVNTDEFLADLRANIKFYSDPANIIAARQEFADYAKKVGFKLPENFLEY